MYKSLSWKPVVKALLHAFQVPSAQMKTEDWLRLLSDKIVQVVATNKQQRHLEERKMEAVRVKLGDKVENIKLVHSVHSKLLVDVKPFLKTMAKVGFV